MPVDSANIRKLAELFNKYGVIDSLQIHKPGGPSIPEVYIAEQ